MPTNSYRRTTGWATSGTARSQRLLHTAHSQQQQPQQDYDLYTIDVKSDEAPSRDGPLPGIEVTTEMVQESAAHDAEVGELQHRKRTTLDA